MERYERAHLVGPGLLLKARGSILCGDFETAAVTLACSVIPLLAGLSRATNTEAIEAAAREALAELSPILRRPMVHAWNATLDELHEARERRPTNVRVDL